MKTLVVFALVPLILVSGCLGFDFNGIFSWFGSDVIKVSERTLTEGTRDIIAIQNVQTIPNPGNILPEKPVQLYYTLVNNDDLKKAESVMTRLYDAPTFKSADPPYERCNAGIVCRPNDGEAQSCATDDACELLPGEERLVSYRLLSPTNEEIANIRAQPRLSFDVTYYTNSSLSFTFPVVTFDEVIKRQRAGESVDLALVASHGSGPLQIDASIVGEHYGLAEYPVTVIFTLKDVGGGSVYGSTIDYSPVSQRLRGMRIKIPKDFTVVSYPEDIFSWYNEGDYTVYVNERKAISMLLDQSQLSMRFEIQLDDPEKANPYRHFTILADAGYVYELRGSLDVTINPFGNR